MKRRTVTTVLALTVAMGGCGNENFGLPVGDLGGIWNATKYEYRDNATGQMVVDLVARDGAQLILSIDNTQSPPTVAATFDAGPGQTGDFDAMGFVDVAAGELTIGAGVFRIEHEGERMTLTNTNATFAFAPGQSLPSTLTIELDRL